MDNSTAIVLVAAITAISSGVNIYLGKLGRKEAREDRQEIKNKIDVKSGELHELMNGKVAEMVELARKGNVADGKALGIAQERGDERERQAATPSEPAHVIVDNTKDSPAHVKQVK